jgi:hypothetical protein
MWDWWHKLHITHGHKGISRKRLRTFVGISGKKEFTT